MATLSFHGAARQVTGSCYLLDTGGNRLLLDCGMFQGPPEVERQNALPFAFDVAALDAVILSHAHLDHSGLLPKLVREGYRGPIYATPPTCDLLDLMLRDAAFLMERDVAWDNRRRRRAGQDDDLTPLYTMADVERTLTLCRSIPYGERFSPVRGVTAWLRDAGHILGSAIVELAIAARPTARRLVFSGDLGNRYAPLLPDPEVVTSADVLLLESTYGDRDHRPLAGTLAEFATIIESAGARGGNVLIPAFAVGRTQELLYQLSELHRTGRLTQQKVFLDSPMAIAATELHRRYQRLLEQKVPARTNETALPPLHFTPGTEESMAINRITGGAIIIAGSGMCTGGRIRHHLKHNLWRREAHVVIVGFQARGTLGRALVDGARTVRLFGEDIAVKATIHTLGGFSAHAGQQELIEWAGRFEPRPHVYLVHGEPTSIEALRVQLKARLGLDATVPEPGDCITL